MLAKHVGVLLCETAAKDENNNEFNIIWHGL